jgi:Type I restriction enzyme R protein N terminus (HSDR_N)
MSERGMTESVVEHAALAWFESAGWSVRHGADIGPGQADEERADYRQVVLEQRLRDALARLNPDLPAEALADALRKTTRLEGAELVGRNRGLEFPEVEPWRDRVDGATLLGEVHGLFSRFVVLPRHGGVAIALWTAHTYSFELGLCTPRLGKRSVKGACRQSSPSAMIEAWQRQQRKCPLSA